MITTSSFPKALQAGFKKEKPAKQAPKKKKKPTK